MSTPIVTLNPSLPKCQLSFEVNGEAVHCLVAPQKTLLEVLREDLQLTGTKHGCELGECGTCTVLVDGVPILSCLELGVACENRSVTTVEGLGQGSLHPIQEALIAEQAAQCGYCIPGMIMQAQALLERTPHPTSAEIRKHMSGNLCRCGTHMRILRAVERAAREP